MVCRLQIRQNLVSIHVHWHTVVLKNPWNRISTGNWKDFTSKLEMNCKLGILDEFAEGRIEMMRICINRDSKLSKGNTVGWEEQRASESSLFPGYSHFGGKVLTCLRVIKTNFRSPFLRPAPSPASPRLLASGSPAPSGCVSKIRRDGGGARMVNKATDGRPVSVGGCLICSKKVKAKEQPSDENELGEMKRLEKAMRKMFQYLLVPEKSWEVLGTSIIAGVPFCTSCYGAVEDIMSLQRQKDAMELKIQNKVEGLGRVVAATPPHLFVMNGFGGSGTGSGSQHKQVLEVWKYFRNPVMQNFVKGMLPNPCVKMQMLSPEENEKYGNVATTAKVKLSDVSKEDKENVSIDENDINTQSISSEAAENKGQLKIKIWKVAQKRVKNGRVKKRKRPIAIKRKVLPRKKILKIKTRLAKPRSRPMLTTNEDKGEESENDEDLENEDYSSDESDLENLFEEIVVTRGYDGEIRSLSPVSPSKTDSSLCDGKPKGLLSASNGVSSESSSNSSVEFKPVVVTKSGIKKLLKDSGESKTSTSATEKSHGSVSQSEFHEKMEDRDCDDSTSEIMEFGVERSSSVMASLTERVTTPIKEVGNNIGENSSWSETNNRETETLRAEINTDRFTAGTYLQETAIPEAIQSSTVNRSPCVPVARCDPMEILAPAMNNDDDERTHSQELMEMMFSPRADADDEELLTPNCDGADGGIDAIIIPPMHFSPTHFGVDLNSYIDDNDLHCPMD